MGSSYRGRSRSYSPPPPPHRRSPPRRRYDDPPPPPYSDRRSQRDRRSPGPSGLLVRNISLSARPEDLRARFESFGPVKDVYLPKNYYTGEQRGFGFVKFRNAEDAAEAKYHLNHTVIGGREIAIVFAAEKRKTPHEMRRSGRVSGHHGGSNRRRSPSRSPRRRYQSYSRSPSPPKHEARGRDRQARDYYSPSRSRSISRSASPRDDGAQRRSRRSPLDKRERGSDMRSPSPRGNGPITHGRRDLRADQRSPGAREDDRTLTRSRPQSLSRSYSPR